MMNKEATMRVVGCAAALSLAAMSLARAQQVGDIIAAFSNPDRPGSISLAGQLGKIMVRGEVRRDVAISVEEDDRGPRRRPSPSPPGGLRRLPLVPGLAVTEDNNHMAITLTGGGLIEMLTPARINLKLATMNDDIFVDNVDGEIEATNANGDIRLTNVSGVVVANTQNGDVRVVLSRVTGDKPMAFTSFNGDVDVTLPSTVKATVRLRSDRGDVFTDFDLQMGPVEAQAGRRPDGRIKIEINRGLTGTINGGGPEFELRTYNGDIRLRKGVR